MLSRRGFFGRFGAALAVVGGSSVVERLAAAPLVAGSVPALPPPPIDPASLKADALAERVDAWEAKFKAMTGNLNIDPERFRAQIENTPPPPQSGKALMMMEDREPYHAMFWPNATIPTLRSKLPSLTQARIERAVQRRASAIHRDRFHGDEPAYCDCSDVARAEMKDVVALIEYYDQRIVEYLGTPRGLMVDRDGRLHPDVGGDNAVACACEHRNDLLEQINDPSLRPPFRAPDNWRSMWSPDERRMYYELVPRDPIPMRVVDAKVTW